MNDSPKKNQEKEKGEQRPANYFTGFFQIRRLDWLKYKKHAASVKEIGLYGRFRLNMIFNNLPHHHLPAMVCNGFNCSVRENPDYLRAANGVRVFPRYSPFSGDSAIDRLGKAIFNI